MTHLEERLTQLTDEAVKRGAELKEKEERCIELVQQITIIETKCQNLQEEVTALNDQLAEVHLTVHYVIQCILFKQPDWSKVTWWALSCV